MEREIHSTLGSSSSQMEMIREGGNRVRSKIKIGIKERAGTRNRDKSRDKNKDRNKMNRLEGQQGETKPNKRKRGKVWISCSPRTKQKGTGKMCI